MTKKILRSGAALALGALTACGGGGGSTSLAPAPRASTAAAQRTTANFTIAVPRATTTASTTRRPKYISPNTQSVIVTLVSVNGTAVTPPALIATNLTASNPACTITSGALTCTVSAPATAGNDVFSIATYDAPQTSASPTTPVGNLLSTATVPVTVVANQANAPATPLVLGGIVQTFVATFAADPHISGSSTAGFSIVGSQPYTLTLMAKDADGNIIVGSGAPTLPTLTTTSSALAITQVNASTYTFQVKRFSAAPVPVTGTVSGAPTGVGATTIGFNVTTVEELWIGAGSVLGFALTPGAAPTAIPSDTITTGLTFPEGLAFDATGNLWVVDGNSDKITEYVPGTNTIAATISASFAPRGIAFDAHGNLWASNLDAQGTVQEYVPPLNNAPVAATISAGLSNPAGIAFDANGDLWVANQSTGAGVNEYVPPTPGAPIANGALVAATVGGAGAPNAGVSGPEAVAFDQTGNLWVVNVFGAGSITEYTQPANNPQAPNATISSATFGIAFDGMGELWAGPSPVNEFSPINGATPMGAGIALPAATAFSLAISP
jgi:sugar lactone lactonase YvrE